MLYKHPAIQAAAVVARPDEKWGETPCAFVELRPGKEATAEEIIAWCRKGLARFKVPRHVVFTELPKTSTGKIQKFKLRDLAKEVCSPARGERPSSALSGTFSHPSDGRRDVCRLQSLLPLRSNGRRWPTGRMRAPRLPLHRAHGEPA